MLISVLVVAVVDTDLKLLTAFEPCEVVGRLELKESADGRGGRGGRRLLGLDDWLLSFFRGCEAASCFGVAGED